jgi:hypothetical protein
MPLPLVAAGVGTGLAGAGLLGSFLQKSHSGVPDISGELANLKSIFEGLRARAEAGITKASGQGRAQSAANMAARGTYSSPVAEHTFGRIEDNRINAIADSNAQLSGQEAQLRAGLLGHLLNMTTDANARKDAINAGRWGALTGIGANLAMGGLGAMGSGGGTPSVSGPLSWQDLLKQMQAQPSNYVMR